MHGSRRTCGGTIFDARLARLMALIWALRELVHFDVVHPALVWLRDAHFLIFFVHLTSSEQLYYIHN